MNFIREEFGEYLKANLTPRRLFALGVGIACFAVCVAAVMGRIHLTIWQTAFVLVFGLLFFEWAG